MLPVDGVDEAAWMDVVLPEPGALPFGLRERRRERQHARVFCLRSRETNLRASGHRVVVGRGVGPARERMRHREPLAGARNVDHHLRTARALHSGRLSPARRRGHLEPGNGNDVLPAA